MGVACCVRGVARFVHTLFINRVKDWTKHLSSVVKKIYQFHIIGWLHKLIRFCPKPHSPLMEHYSRIPGNTISSLLCATFANYCANLRKNNFWKKREGGEKTSWTSYYTPITTLALFYILFRKLNRGKTIVQSVPAGRVASLCTAAASKCMGKHHRLAQIS